MKDNRKNFKISPEIANKLKMLSDRLHKSQTELIEEYVNAMALLSIGFKNDDRFGCWFNVSQSQILIQFYGNPSLISGSLTQPISTDCGDAIAEKTLKNDIELLKKPKKKATKNGC